MNGYNLKKQNKKQREKTTGARREVGSKPTSQTRKNARKKTSNKVLF
jgi:hypothetical protein